MAQRNPADEYLDELKKVRMQIKRLQEHEAKLKAQAQEICTHPNGDCGCGVFVCPDCGYDDM